MESGEWDIMYLECWISINNYCRKMGVAEMLILKWMSKHISKDKNKIFEIKTV